MVVVKVNNTILLLQKSRVRHCFETGECVIALYVYLSGNVCMDKV